MNPALSVILFTSASGAGYGLLFVTALLLGVEAFPGEKGAALAALVVALLLIATGLLSSTFHLGRPERAWRAFSQWRSSWLSREGVAAVLTILPHVGLIFLIAVDARQPALFLACALAAALGALATVTATAMIYATLRSIRHWHHRLVPPIYLLLGVASGLVWLLAVLRLGGADAPAVAIAGVVALTVAWSLKHAYWRSVDGDPSRSTRASATSLPGSVRVLDPPHTESNYLLDEMGYRVARKHAHKLRRIALSSGWLVAGVLVIAQTWWSPLAVAAALAATLGVIVERWLFFAEAEHTVALFYR